MNLHVDFINNNWDGEYQECVGQAWVNWPEQPESARIMLSAIPEKYGRGSYFFVTEAHEDKDCMFFDGIGHRLAMRVVTHDDGYRLPSVPSQDAVSARDGEGPSRPLRPGHLSDLEVRE